MQCKSSARLCLHSFASAAAASKQLECNYMTLSNHRNTRIPPRQSKSPPHDILPFFRFPCLSSDTVLGAHESRQPTNHNIRTPSAAADAHTHAWSRSSSCSQRVGQRLKKSGSVSSPASQPETQTQSYKQAAKSKAKNLLFLPFPSISHLLTKQRKARHASRAEYI
ncbi:hypothetical protein DL98DRAFT_237898 [Cadophora sp. DSE1049]|nr:hypothetical protein DL98DRAFT_237898 [Cadophora sp. DSE1049]